MVHFVAELLRMLVAWLGPRAMLPGPLGYCRPWPTVALAADAGMHVEVRIHL